MIDATAARKWKREAIEFRDTPEPGPAAVVLGETPYSMFQGDMELGSVSVPAHVLNDASRVIAQREMVGVLSPGRESGGLQRYIDALPKEIHKLDLVPNLLKFRVPASQFIGNGYRATFLIDICLAYMKARERKLLKRSQFALARRAEVIVMACAKLGIEALVDEATGYDKFKKKREYQIKLHAFIAEDMREWTSTFPSEFWMELARLEGVRYSPSHRPIRWGKYVMEFVYDALDKGVGAKLRQINPNPERGNNHHQWLAVFGRDRLSRHLGAVIAIMKLCSTMDEFRAKFGHVFRHEGLQLPFGFRS